MPKKELPSLNPLEVECYFTEEQVKTILERAGVSLLDDDKTGRLTLMTDRLDFAARNYLRKQQIEPDTSRNERELLKKTLQHTKELNILVQQLSENESMLRLLLSPRDWFPNLENLLAAFQKDLEEQLADFPIPPRGRPPKTARLYFVATLAHHCEKHTGQEIGFSRPYDGGAPTGPFFRFVSACLNHIGVPETDEAVAAAIREITNPRRQG